MSMQRIGERKLQEIRRRTGVEYTSAWNRGGSAWWVCHLPAGPRNLANLDHVNRSTWEVVPFLRDGVPA